MYTRMKESHLTGKTFAKIAVGLFAFFAFGLIGLVAPKTAQAAVTVEFSSVSATSTNEGTADNLPVLLVSGSLSAAGSIEINYSDGAAVLFSDFSLPNAPFVVAIPTGTYDGTISTAIAAPFLVLVDDTDVDGDKAMLFSLINPSPDVSTGDANGNTISQTQHLYTITDDDTFAPNEITLDVSQLSITEGSSSTFIFTTDRPAVGDITMSYQFAEGSGGNLPANLFTFNGSASASGTIVIPDGQSSATITLTPTDDNNPENDEYVTLSITSVENITDPQPAFFGSGQVPLFIIDDDSQHKLSFTTAFSAVDEGVSVANVAVQLSNPAPAGGVSFMVSAQPNLAPGAALLNTDFSLPSTTVTIPEGQSSVDVAVQIIDDPAYEGNESLLLAISNPVNATLALIPERYLSITDNDSLTLSFVNSTSTDNEDVTTRTVQLVLSGPTNQNVTAFLEIVPAQSSAEPAVDWALPAANVSIPAGQTTATVEITIVNDSVQESDETATIKIATVGNAALGPTTTHTFVIGANDVPAPVVNTGGGNGGGGGGGGSYTPAFNAPVGGFSVKVESVNVSGSVIQASLVLNGGTATRMALSNAGDFSGSSQQVYRTSTAWTLSAGAGLKTVYARFYDAYGSASPVVSTTVNVTGTVAAVLPPAGEVLGVQVSLLDELITKLKPGTTSDEVRTLQTELQKLGYFSKTFRPTRYYGLLTRKAVEKYLDSKADFMSVDELVASLQFGHRNNRVVRLQNELKKLGFLSNSVRSTGYFGLLTKNAVVNYLASK